MEPVQAGESEQGQEYGQCKEAPAGTPDTVPGHRIRGWASGSTMEHMAIEMPSRDQNGNKEAQVGAEEDVISHRVGTATAQADSEQPE